MKAFLMIGQSNMSGRGKIGDLPALPNDHVSVWHGEGFEPATEPVVRDRPFSAEGMGLSFGNTVFALTGWDVALIPCSLGGSPLKDWQPGETLYENAVRDTVAAVKNGAELAGILWHQGETDAKEREASETYAARLQKTIGGILADVRAACVKEDVSKRIPARVPVVVGEIGSFLDKEEYPYVPLVNEQIRAFADAHEDCACVSSRGLTDRGDRLHFNTRSQRLLGLRYAECWQELAKGCGSLPE